MDIVHNYFWYVFEKWTKYFVFETYFLISFYYFSALELFFLHKMYSFYKTIKTENDRKLYESNLREFNDLNVLLIKDQQIIV